MTTNKTETNWLAKEKRELFCKSVNSMIMHPEKFYVENDKERGIKIDNILSISKNIVDTAFENYPDEVAGKEETKPF
jgi:hypothetical protein